MRRQMILSNTFLGPLWIVVELCEHGNLLNFLRKNRQEISDKTGGFISSLDPLLRVRIAYDVSKGMHYLEDKKVNLIGFVSESIRYV